MINLIKPIFYALCIDCDVFIIRCDVAFTKKGYNSNFPNSLLEEFSK